MKVSMISLKFNLLVYSFAILSFSLFLLACQKDDNIIEATSPTGVVEETIPAGTYPRVDNALWPFFQQFESDAAAQGFDIDLARLGITGIIEDIEGEFVAGQCNYFSHSPNHIILDAEFWRRASNNFKEMIVFHELGHCVLDRGHREGSLDNGLCLSIMRSGEITCRDAYNSFTKDYYLEELFHPDNIPDAN